MKILHILYFTEFAGTEKVCTDLCNELSLYNDVTLISNKVDYWGKEITNYILPSVKFIEIQTENNRYDIVYLYNIAKILKKISPDVIHCHNAKFLEIIKYSEIFLNKKIPIVFTKHNTFAKKRIKLADACVGISQETLKLCNAKKNILIENGISFKQTKQILDQSNFNIIGVGRLEEDKNWQLTINALSNVKFDYKFYILGQGIYEKNLAELIKKLNLQEKVILTGFVENPWDYISSSNLQLLPSIKEAFSLALIEGIYYGKMVFALDTANHREVLGDDFIIENDSHILTNKLNEIYNNYNVYLDKFKKVKEKSQEFDIKNVAKKYIELYKSLV